MEPAARGVQVPVEAMAGLHITPRGDGGSCPQKRVVWHAQDTVVLIPGVQGEDATAGAVVEADATAAGVAQGEDGTAGAVLEPADATAGAVGQNPPAGPLAQASNATAGAVVEAAQRGLLPGSSSTRPPPPGGKAEGRWKGWYDEKRWHMVRGREVYRSYGEGPETGGHDCPQSADPLRTERNRRRKAKKERIRQEREADQHRSQKDLWNRAYERAIQRPPSPEEDDGTDTSER